MFEHRDTHKLRECTEGPDSISFLYVLAPNTTSPQIDVLSVGNAPGQAKQFQTFDVGAALKKNKTKFGG